MSPGGEGARFVACLWLLGTGCLTMHADAQAQQADGLSQPGLAFVLFDDTGLQRPAECGVEPQVNTKLTGYNDCSKLWMGRVRFPAAGEVTFDAEAAQGLRLFVGGKLVIDGWSPDGARRGVFEATAGEPVAFRLEYYHLGGEAYVRLHWAWDGHARELVPTPVFAHTERDVQDAEGIVSGKQWVAPGNHGPVPKPDVPSAPAGDEEFKSFIYEPGTADRAPSETPLKLGPGPHLFIDDFLIESSEDITRHVNRPVRDRRIPNPIITGPEDRNFQPFLTVLQDPETERFRVWYGAWKQSQDTTSSHIGYMESEDGINWIRPHRVLDDPAPIQFGDSVVDDGPNCPDPSRRYALGWWANGGLKIATSADGLTWTPVAPFPVLLHNHDITNIWRDTLRDRYVATASVYITGPTWSGTRRVTMQSVSEDLLHWSKPWYIITPQDGKDEGETQFYAMNAHITRGGLWIGLVKVLRDELKAPGIPEGAYGVGYTTLAWTRDGEHWYRDREPFFEPDPDVDAWDHAHAWLDYQLLVGDEVFIYYGGYKSGHKWNRFAERQIGLLRMPRDRYVSRRAGRAEGTLRTPPMVLEADDMTVNADVRGWLRMRILDESGAPVAGFDFADFQPIQGDLVAHKAQWARSLKSLRGKPVSFEIRMVDTDLFGFDLTWQPPTFPATGGSTDVRSHQ